MEIPLELTHHGVTAGSPLTDLQIGRSTESPIDFVVTDTSGGGKDGEDPSIAPSTISRFACRIVCERNPPYTARIYAAGFDSSKNIFLGVSSASRGIFGQTAVVSFESRFPAAAGESHQMEKPRWTHGWPDHQRGAGDAPRRVPRRPQAGSVEGDLGLRRCVRTEGNAIGTQPGQTGPPLLSLSDYLPPLKVWLNVLLLLGPLQAEGETSALRDGSLVDLCGATLLWRTGEGLMRAPTLRHLEALRQELNASRPQCPVGLNTLAFPSLPRSHRYRFQHRSYF